MGAPGHAILRHDMSFVTLDRVGPRGRFDAPAVQLLLFALAVVGGLCGLYLAVVHATSDPAGDVISYYNAGARLNAGIPLYEQTTSPDSAEHYWYPPLLAIAFRPLALLPFEVAAAIWMCVVVASLIATIVALKVRNRWTWLALGWLAPAIGWAVTIGQAHVVATFLLTVGSPLSLALGGHLKIFPALAAIYWLGRRDWSRLRRFVLWGVLLTLASFVLEPAGTIAYLGFPSFELVGNVMNFSLYAISPVLWAATLVAVMVGALVLARTRFGWPLAVLLTVVVSPRLLMYQLSYLIAAVRRPPASRAN